MAKEPKITNGDTEEAVAVVEVKKTYAVRPGFVVHFDDGRDPVEGGEFVELTDAEAAVHAVQVEALEADDGAGD